jgi:hypothetical protein
MKKILIFAVGILCLNLYSVANANSLTVSGSIGYEYTVQSGQERELTPNAAAYITDDINKNVSFHGSFSASKVNTEPTYSAIDDFYVDFKGDTMSYLIGFQSYTLGDGFIASLGGVDALRTVWNGRGKNVTLFYTKNSTGMFAADLSDTNILGSKNLSLEGVFFKQEASYSGIKVADQLTSNAVCSVQFVRNLDTQAKGYQFTTQYGDAQQAGQADITLAYRNVGQGAVSPYSADTNFDDSKGLRVSADYAITNNLMLSGFHDFAKTQENTSEDETNIQLTRSF